MGLVLAALFRAIGHAHEDVGARPVAAEQIAQHLGGRDEAAAIIAQVEDDVGHALRLETGEGVAQRLLGRQDEGAQIDIADAAAAIVDHPRAIAVRYRHQVEVAFGHRYGPRAGRVGNAQQPGRAGAIRPHRIGHGIGTARREQRRHAAHVGDAGADLQYLRAAIDAGGERRAVLERFDDEQAGGPAVGCEAQAEAGARPRLIIGILRLDGGEIGEIAIPPLRPRTLGQRVNIVVDTGIAGRAERGRQGFGEKIPFLERRRRPILPLPHRTGGGRRGRWRHRRRRSARTVRPATATSRQHRQPAGQQRQARNPMLHHYSPQRPQTG